MSEIARIADAVAAALAERTAATLATVVAVEGSSFRRPGARMLIRADGATVGCVSGGCLDRDVAEHARAVVAAGVPRLVRYDAPADDDSPFGLGLGCGGAIRVLLAPATPSLGADLEWLARAGAPAALVTLWEAGSPALASGTCWRLGEGGASAAPPPALTALLADEARRAHAAGAPLGVERDSPLGRLGLLVEPALPAPSLWLVGASPVAAPLATIASGLGWRVTICVPRGSLPDALPGDAALRVRTGPLAEALADAPPGALAVAMTHQIEGDLAALRAWLPRRPRYLGLLGSRARCEALVKRLAAEAGALDPRRLAAFHAPAGLDLGGEEPAAVALAIAAEIQATLAGRAGGPLREAGGPLHGPLRVAEDARLWAARRDKERPGT